MPVAALVLGIVGLVFSLVPCLGMYAIPLTLTAAILGYVGMKKPTGRGMAIAGMVCGIIGTAIAGWWLYAYLTVKDAVEDADKDLKKAEEKLKQDLEKAAKDTQPNP